MDIPALCRVEMGHREACRLKQGLRGFKELEMMEVSYKEARRAYTGLESSGKMDGSIPYKPMSVHLAKRKMQLRSFGCKFCGNMSNIWGGTNPTHYNFK